MKYSICFMFQNCMAQIEFFCVPVSVKRVVQEKRNEKSACCVLCKDSCVAGGRVKQFTCCGGSFLLKTSKRSVACLFVVCGYPSSSDGGTA